jgi:hypothetical protein
MTDNAAVLRLLRIRGRQGVTPLEALREVGTFRLSARVWDLRHEGHRIDREWLTTPGNARVAKYILVEEAPKQLRLGDVA